MPYKFIFHTLHSILHNERDRLVLWLPVLLGTGVGMYFALEAEPSLWTAATLPCALALCVAMWRWFGARMVALAVFFMVAGFTLALWHTHLIDAPVLRKTLYDREVEGTITDIEIREKGPRLTLADVAIEGVRENTTPRRVTISLKDMAGNAQVGDRVRVKAILFPPPSPAMPGAYDFARDFYFKSIGAVGHAPKPPELVQAAPPDDFHTWLNAFRLSINHRIIHQMSAENGPVAVALMVGEQSSVSKEVSDAMRDSGIYHVLSISGLHMSLAAGLVYFMVRLLLALYPRAALTWPTKKIAAMVGLCGAFAYLMVAGYPVPAIRSFIMVACVLLAVLLDRQGISVYSLAWAALIILILGPSAMLGASFQLSFAATLAIVALYERYGGALYKSEVGIITQIKLYFLALVATSLAASIATTPLVIYQFNRMAIWSVATNMLLVPLVSFWIMPTALLAFVLMPWGLEGWALHMLDIGIGWMIAGARFFADLPFANINIVSPHFIGFLLMVYGGLWFFLWRGHWRIWGLPAVVMGLATAFLYKPYDLLVSDNGSAVALKTESGDYVFLRGKPDSFDADIWLRAAGKERGLSLGEIANLPDAPSCDKLACRFTAHNTRIVVGVRKGRHRELCHEEADMIIYADWLDDKECAHIRWRIDKDFLEDYGATAIRFGDAPEIITAAQSRGQRPWVPLPYSLYRAANPVITNENIGEKHD